MSSSALGTLGEPPWNVKSLPLENQLLKIVIGGREGLGISVISVISQLHERRAYRGTSVSVP